MQLQLFFEAHKLSNTQKKVFLPGPRQSVSDKQPTVEAKVIVISKSRSTIPCSADKVVREDAIDREDASRSLSFYKF